MSAQKSRPQGVFTGIVGLIGFSALAGVLVTVMVTPALAVTSVATTRSIDLFDNLPEHIVIEKQPQQNKIYATKGSKNVQIATVYSQNRVEITWEQVPEVVRQATLAAEDIRFYDHGGIDLRGIARAVVKNATSSNTEGASTLTQQLVKNICIMAAVKDNDGPTEKAALKAAIGDCQESTIDRKLREMKYAIGLEKKYSKNEIMLAYLNIAGFGGNTYGIQSAAQRYFGVSARNLDVAQAASLLAIVQLPGERSLENPDHYAANQARRDDVLKRMLEARFITAEEHDEAVATAVDKKFVTLTAPRNGCIAANQYAKQFCDYVVRSVKDLEALGKNAAERSANWKTGGYKLFTTLDLKQQKVAQSVVRKYVPSNETRLRLGGSAIGVGVGTGEILFMAQNKRFDDTAKGGGRSATAINFNTDFGYGGSSGFQVGSLYKVFTLLSWLESGHSLEEMVPASPRTYDLSAFTDSCNGPYAGSWSPRNDAPAPASMSVRQATAYSVNGAYVSMALELDLCRTKQIAEALGVHTAVAVDNPATTLVDNVLQTNPSSIIGTNDIAPLTMSAAYAGLANHGIFCSPIAVTGVRTAAGQDLPGQGADCTRAVDEDVAAAAVSALQTAMSNYNANTRDGTPLMGKTGTTDKSKQTWVTSSSSKVTSTVWVGNISGEYPMRSYPGGGNIRHLVSHEIMSSVNRAYGGGEFDTAPQSLITGATTRVGAFIGATPAVAKSAIEGAGLVYSENGTVDSALPVGQIARQKPAAGAPIANGGTVRVWLSNGTKSVVPEVAGRDVDAARAALGEAGFATVDETCVLADENRPRDTVVATSPAAGKTALRSAPVTLTVARANC